MISFGVAFCVFASEQWWALFFSPKRVCLAQARLTEARPSETNRGSPKLLCANYRPSN